MNGKPWEWLPKVPTLDALVDRDRDHRCPGFGVHQVCVKADAVADLPTRFGAFRIVAFSNNKDGKEHLALVHGDAMGGREVPTRLHSECLTGDALGSLRCDCREQLQAALEALACRPRPIAPGTCSRTSPACRTRMSRCGSSRTRAERLTSPGDTMARKQSAAARKVEKVMHEFKHGTLESGGSGQIVTSRPQAIAIALSEARRAGAKAPRAPKKRPSR